MTQSDKVNKSARAYYLGRVRYWMKETKGDQYTSADKAEKETRAKFGRDVKL